MKEYAFFMILDKEMHIFEHKSKLSVLLIWLFFGVFFSSVSLGIICLISTLNVIVRNHPVNCTIVVVGTKKGL